MIIIVRFLSRVCARERGLARVCDAISLCARERADASSGRSRVAPAHPAHIGRDGDLLSLARTQRAPRALAAVRRCTARHHGAWSEAMLVGRRVAEKELVNHTIAPRAVVERDHLRTCACACVRACVRVCARGCGGIRATTMSMDQKDSACARTSARARSNPRLQARLGTHTACGVQRASARAACARMHARAHVPPRARAARRSERRPRVRACAPRTSKSQRVHIRRSHRLCRVASHSPVGAVAPPSSTRAHRRPPPPLRARLAA